MLRVDFLSSCGMFRPVIPPPLVIESELLSLSYPGMNLGDRDIIYSIQKATWENMILHLFLVEDKCLVRMKKGF